MPRRLTATRDLMHRELKRAEVFRGSATSNSQHGIVLCQDQHITHLALRALLNERSLQL